MNILVIDDTLAHRQAAVEQLGGGDHNLVVVDSYDKGMDQLLYSRKTWDVVLTDLQMPARSDIERDRGEPETIKSMGIWLVFYAAMRKTKYIGLLTDVNHHADPASDAVSKLSNWHYETVDKTTFKGPWQFMEMNGARVMFKEHDSWMSSGPKDWKDLLDDLVRGTSE